LWKEVARNIYWKVFSFWKNIDLSKDRMVGLRKSISGSSAYIPQQELFYPTQTVDEAAVAFTANLTDSVRLNARTYGFR